MAENRSEETYNMQSLQQDAIRRAREMQARARFPSGYMPVSAVQHEEPHPHTEEMPVNTRAPEPPRQSGGNSPARPEPPRPAPPPEEEPMPEKFAGGALDFLLKDSEKTLILVLMLILLEEKTDSSLIFALMYLVI